MSGGDSKMETPVPIPNTEVKHLYANGSKFNLARVGSCQAFSLIYIHTFTACKCCFIFNILS